ncbi:hypothetical protein QP185_05910 [Sphingomonas aerolata]|uniref:hypothetical protein n=1 Tax=Sphingomonas aerolata TaxID=185951 RepID=UPI002FE1AA80
MNILLIEDDTLKAERILDFLSDFADGDKICHERSYNTGLRSALLSQPSLIVLDMTLPTYDVGAKSREGRSRTMGGVDLMRKLKLKGVKLPVIVVSQFTTFGEGPDMIEFADLMEQCTSEFPGASLRAFDTVHHQTRGWPSCALKSKV